MEQVHDRHHDLRLENKGAITHTEGEKARRYSPTVTRSQAAVQETETLLHRLYRGSVAMMVNTIADGRGLSKEDIERSEEHTSELQSR